MLACAILDDYQGVALSYGDFSGLADRVAVTVFRDNVADTEALLARLAPFDIVVAMRERTPFDAARSEPPHLSGIADPGGTLPNSSAASRAAHITPPINHQGRPGYSIVVADTQAHSCATSVSCVHVFGRSHP